MSSPNRQPFWLCHECGAQMRPIKIDGINHCASCNGEFLEILDADVNPDPFHELPPAPPTRPGEEIDRWYPPENEHEHGSNGPMEGNFMSSLFGNMFGATVGDPHGQGNVAGAGPNRPSSAPSGSRSGGRSFQFNMPGGGRGQVVFGSFNGGAGGDPFGNTGTNSMFPDFNPPPANRRGGQHGQFQPLGPNDPMSPHELIESMMAALSTDQNAPPGLRQMFGMAGNTQPGDYVGSQARMDQLLEEFLRAAGPQGPLPASDVVIEGLPRFKLTQEVLDASQFKDCPVCQDDFVLGDEVKRVPCKHIFHPACLDPWLKTNGTCPVCRFSLVPDPANGPAQSTRPPNTSPNPSGNTGSQGESMVTGMLRRLFGPSGTDSTPTSPTGADAPNNTASPSSTTATAGPGSSFRPSSSRQPSGPPGPTPNPNPQGVPYGSSPYRPLNRDSIASNASGAYHSAAPPTDRASERRPAEAPRERVPTDELNRAIPEEYRARHRQRERDRQHELPEEDVD